MESPRSLRHTDDQKNFRGKWIRRPSAIWQWLVLAIRRQTSSRRYAWTTSFISSGPSVEWPTTSRSSYSERGNSGSQILLSKTIWKEKKKSYRLRTMCLAKPLFVRVSKAKLLKKFWAHCSNLPTEPPNKVFEVSTKHKDETNKGARGKRRRPSEAKINEKNKSQLNRPSLFNARNFDTETPENARFSMRLYPIFEEQAFD